MDTHTRIENLLVHFEAIDKKTIYDEILYSKNDSPVMKKLQMNYYDWVLATLQKRDCRFTQQLMAFLNESKRPILFIISETKHVQSIYTNRPIRIVQELIHLECDVLYAYRRNDEECFDVKEFRQGHLFEGPLDLFLKNIEFILNSSRKKKTVFFEFPIKPFVTYCSAFSHHQWLIIYDIRDHWLAMKQANTCELYDPLIDKKLIDSAQIIFTASRKLATLVSLNDKEQVYQIPNGAYDRNREKNERTNRHTIGYFGTFNEAWVDFDLITQMVMKQKNTRFEWIGPPHPRIPQTMNSFYLGPKPFEELAQLTCTWKAGIIPFQNNTITEYCDPIKYYDYVSLGLGVISTLIPQLQNNPCVEIGDTTNKFIEATQQVMGCKKPIDQLELMSSRVSQMLGYIEEGDKWL